MKLPTGYTDELICAVIGLVMLGVGLGWLWTLVA